MMLATEHKMEGHGLA